MTRHCALILAHRNPLIFKELTGCLINAGMDVFAHIDAKTPVSAFEHTSQPVQFLQDRYPITWGSFAIIKATLALVKHAVEKGPYQSYSLLSGDSFPVRAPSTLLSLLNDHADFIDYTVIPADTPTYARIQHTYLPDTRLGQLTLGVPFQERYLDDALMESMRPALQSHENRVAFLHDYIYAKGSQWWTLSQYSLGRILELIERDDRLMEAFRFSAIPDEAFFQTALLHVCPRAANIRAGLIYTKWDVAPAPYTFKRLSDIEYFKTMDRPLARKFSDESMPLIEMVKKELWTA
jgi:hypothetical protein